MLTRVERNKKYKRSKRKFRLFILITIILAFASMIHINNSYNELFDTTKSNQIFAIKKEKDTMGIILFGEEVKISRDYIFQGKEVLQSIQRQILYWINNTIKNKF